MRPAVRGCRLQVQLTADRPARRTPLKPLDADARDHGVEPRIHCTHRRPRMSSGDSHTPWGTARARVHQDAVDADPLRTPTRDIRRRRRRGLTNGMRVRTNGVGRGAAAAPPHR